MQLSQQLDSARNFVFCSYVLGTSELFANDMLPQVHGNIVQYKFDPDLE